MDENAVLGHRRLSIIDIADGQQPMGNEDGSIWVTFNGEIYNHTEIRSWLQGKGHHFRTRCDTEVLLHLYEEKKEAMVHELNGMFAFAIWESPQKKLFLARDRLGQKPLYYTRAGDSFLFASEIKSLLASGKIAAEPNLDCLPEYLVFRYIAGRDTFFKNVFLLLPGETLTLLNGQIKRAIYWRPRVGQVSPSQSRQDTLKTTAHLLDDAVSLRMMSDVPLGALCSGGVDSSLVSALARSKSSKGNNFHTFSVSFKDEACDESQYACEVSKHIGSEHHQLTTDENDFCTHLEHAITLHDEPLNHPNSVHIYLISKLAKNHVTVALTGEGADEVFGGYPRYLAFRLSRAFRRLGPIAKLAPDLFRLIGGRKFRLLAENIENDNSRAALFNSRFTPETEVIDLLGQMNCLGAYRASIYNETADAGATPLQSLLILDQQTYLPSILIRQDKLSMGASIESRVPFLDYRLVDFANSIPDKWRLKRWSTKPLVKEIARPFLPGGIPQRRKVGFGVPLADWFRHQSGFGSYLELLLEPRSFATEILDLKKLESVLEAHRHGKDCSEILWTILNLELWWRQFICKSN